MMSAKLVRKERILEYLDNMLRQVEDIRSIPVPGKEFFLQREKTIQIKAIKYSLACAIQDVTRVCAHIASALSLWKVRESESEAILALSDAAFSQRNLLIRSKPCPPSGTESFTTTCQMNLMRSSSTRCFRALTISRHFQSISSPGSKPTDFTSETSIQIKKGREGSIV